MAHRETRLTGVAAALGGLFLLVSAIPGGWYGVASLDSYVFDPPIGSPLWFHRSVAPALAVLGVFGLFLGLLGLLRRDWSVAGRLRRWSGVLALIGLGGLTATSPLFAYESLGNTAASTIVALAGFALAAASAVIFVPALVALALGYLRTNRPALGYALGWVVVAVPLAVYLVPSSTSAFAAALPVAASAVAIGHDLFHRPEPLPSGHSDVSNRE